MTALLTGDQRREIARAEREMHGFFGALPQLPSEPPIRALTPIGRGELVWMKTAIRKPNRGLVHIGRTVDGFAAEMWRGRETGEIMLEVEPPAGDAWFSLQPTEEDARAIADEIVRMVRGGTL